ncbi:L-aspartate oxidase [Pontibacter qinzhouensis]|uniref:L-aspartate oxidase n=1 Tax=Pontibacter qinzhouensis TaxID=2603253 RepID=A0A5C8J761_9BACT|nr:L-aspartate oxidase [Pontibacter qinzhouensis]TXK32817.1 L-aspartate oxidase [Pontibacter qinzhouensis]
MKSLYYDYVVLGSGIAGLTFALKVAEAGTVAVVCKSSIGHTNTSFAQGGIAAALRLPDSDCQHVQDTLVAGAGLCNEEAVRFMAAQAPAAIEWLQQKGVCFDKTAGGEEALGLEGGHSRHRIVHVKDHTGLSVQEALVQEARQHPAITVLENCMAAELLVNTAGETICHGVSLIHLKDDTTLHLEAKAVVLATGGSGQVFRHTTNPAIATGDGLAMAARAGADIGNMEFFQFHPTALYEPAPQQETFLISEAVRGAGAELVLPSGERFMHEYHPLGSLAPRDIVARAVLSEMKRLEHPCLYLDARHLPARLLERQFPVIYDRCRKAGFLPETDLIPVVPAAHYQCGGVQTDLQGSTSLRGLYAIGEVACTGVHGANRLASNSLLEGVVFAISAATHAAQVTSVPVTKLVDRTFDHILFSLTDTTVVEPQVRALKQKLQALMWEHASIIRNMENLRQAKTEVASLKKQLDCARAKVGFSPSILELYNLLLVAQLILNACLLRPGSIGGHYVVHETEAALAG